LIAEGLARAHAGLLKDLQKLEQAVSPAAPEDLAGLQAQLEAGWMHLLDHFRFEEQNGYMSIVRKREPRLERTIDQLAEEHGLLKQTLESLIKQASTATSLSSALRQEVHQWIERVRQHEARENRLVQDAFGLDIGAED
jgi:iron-sulfur cluster repair protein YtfE (RIC family)